MRVYNINTEHTTRTIQCIVLCNLRHTCKGVPTCAEQSTRIIIYLHTRQYDDDARE